MQTSKSRIIASRKSTSNPAEAAAEKLRTRTKALEPGLTGQDVALPDEDVADITDRFGGFQTELKPKTQIGRILVRRSAFLSVRLERLERFEVGILSKQIRHAEEMFDNARLTGIESDASYLSSDPLTVCRRLQGSPEGIDVLLQHWAELRSDLMIEGEPVWTSNHWVRTERLLGHAVNNLRVSRPQALSEAARGFFGNLEPTDGEGLNDHDRALWAKNEVAKVIDAEVERLKALRVALKPDLIAKDRAEAASRLLFDPSPEMVLARKYEAATERSFYRALKELRIVEKMFEESGGSNLTEYETEVCEKLGLNFPGDAPAVEPQPPAPEKVAETPRKVVMTLPEPVGLDEFPPSKLPYPPARPTNQVPIAIGRGNRRMR